MHYEIYIDVVFFTNLLIDYILIRFTGILFRCGRSRKRALLGAAAGAVFSCWIIYLQSFLESGIFLPALVLLHGGCAAGMLVIGCNLKRGSLLLKAILTLYFAAFLCGGSGLRHLREIKITINRRNAGFFMSNFIYFYVVRSCILSLYVI